MNACTSVARPPPKPVLIFDGDCTFCRRWIARWKQSTQDQVDYVPLQSDRVAAEFPELSRSDLETAVHLVEPDGRVCRGAEAVFRSLATAHPRLPWIYRRLPGVAPLTELAYGIVARNRTFFSILTRLLWGPNLDPPTYFFVRRLFLFLLGLVYLSAFASLSRQWPGLIGSHGIIPAQQFLQSVRERAPDQLWDRLRLAPSLCWLDAGDRMLHGLILAGISLSILVILNIAPAPALFLLWLIYLSLASVSSVFLGYQWDNLLLESGFLAIFFAPGRLLPGASRDAPPSAIVLWLLRWLLFRLMFASGAVKLASGDSTWQQLAALTFHYQTQPLPTPLAWFAHQLPAALQRASCGVMFAIELGAPFLLLLPRRPRLVAFWAFTALMLLIALTGNYTFFNLLTVTLAVTALDDQSLRTLTPQAWANRIAQGPRFAWFKPPPKFLRWARTAAMALLALVVLAVTTPQMLSLAGVRFAADHPFVQIYRLVAPVRSINGYGLFAVMTTERREIIVEGSDDGVTWAPYEFLHKPGNIQRAPTWVAPHQPRLDWQMWFAALGTVRDNPWFVRFCLRLFQGQPEVLALLKSNPFPNQPPKYIRATLYEYQFTTPAERRQTRAWWNRNFLGIYLPPIDQSGRPPPAPDPAVPGR